MIETRINQMKTFTLFIIVLCSVFIHGFQIDVGRNIVSAEAAESSTDWNATLKMSGSDGTGFTLEFGESANASDGVDSFDMPIPPSPPVIPHINARFLTSFEPPNAELYNEVKFFPDTNKTWNFSVIWFAGPGNTSTIDLTIQWKISELNQSEYDTIVLLKNNTLVTDMLESNQYRYNTASNEPSFFSIVCSEGDITTIPHDNDNTTNHNNETGGSSDTPFFSFSTLLGLLIIVIFFYKKSLDKK
jgi:hypothetical protein